MPTVFTASTPVLKEFEKTVCAYKLRSCGVILSCICPLMYMNNPDIYKKPMPGKALCLPMTIGSTTGGMVLCTACSMGKQPACMLFSQPIDSPAGTFLTKLEVEDVTSIGVLSDGSEGVFGLDGLTFADRYRRET